MESINIYLKENDNGELIASAEYVYGMNADTEYIGECEVQEDSSVSEIKSSIVDSILETIGEDWAERISSFLEDDLYEALNLEDYELEKEISNHWS